MNLPDTLLPSQWILAAWLIFIPLAGWLLYRAPWHTLRSEVRLHQLLGACVLLLGIWSIKTGIKPGLNFHLLGATVMTLMFGPRLALFGLLLVLAGVTLAGMSGLSSFAANALTMAVLPVALSHLLYRLADRKLPRHFLVYLFINGFFGGGLAIYLSGLASTLLMGTAGAYSFDYLLSSYLPYYLLLGWSEALLTGMAMSLLVVFRPDWVSTFDDARYIRNQ